VSNGGRIPWQLNFTKKLAPGKNAGKPPLPPDREKFAVNPGHFQN
jgi:hypothetical protein